MTIKVSIPKDLSADERKLLTELQAKSGGVVGANAKKDGKKGKTGKVIDLLHSAAVPMRLFTISCSAVAFPSLFLYRFLRCFSWLVLAFDCILELYFSFSFLLIFIYLCNHGSEKSG